ncbi:MarR family winged helix-turn-helix transcriptional regulator [Noviherbaspirillum sp. ST9]|uniref:MarR family winged helix-turn-helix transcriptional regulator n=1 Tax=Noviherbaspirillum sp. ST9 TaxID=3401606 RepID=UPI003B5878D1
MKPLKLPCYCGSIRQASRVVTQMYDKALKPSGVKITQFSILRLLSRFPGLTTGEMAEALVMDSTTLTRTLKIIHDSKWIASTPGEDKRERHWALTGEGQARLQEAVPLWKSAQKEFAEKMSGVDLDELTQSVFQLVQKSTEAVD